MLNIDFELVHLGLLLMAFLYSAVGHGGASGYMAVLVILGFSPNEMRPVVLAMNVVVTTWVLWRLKANFSAQKSLFFPLVLASFPMAFIGGALQLSDAIFYIVLAVLLAISATRLIMTAKTVESTVEVRVLALVVAGLLLGFISGLTAIGGGVLLSPLLLFCRWSTMQNSIPIVAGFILLNSLSGLSGFFYSGGGWPADGFWFLLIAFIGCLFGIEFAKKYAPFWLLRYLLAVVLLVASVKMLYLTF